MSDSRSYPDPTQHPEVANWIKTLDATPADQLPRLQFADWLQEHGYDNAAKWQRLFADQGKYPHKVSDIAGDDEDADEIERPEYQAEGWYPTNWREHHILGHAALPATFTIGMYEHPAPGDERDFNTQVVYPSMDAPHPESAVLHAMHHIPYDKYNKTTTKD